MKKKYILPSIADIELNAEVILASGDNVFDDEVFADNPNETPTEDFGFAPEPADSGNSNEIQF